MDKSGTTLAPCPHWGEGSDNLPGTMVITRAHLGRLAVAVRFDGPTLLVLADHDAPIWLVLAAAILAKRDAEQGRRSA